MRQDTYERLVRKKKPVALDIEKKGAIDYEDIGDRYHINEWQLDAIIKMLKKDGYVIEKDRDGYVFISAPEEGWT